MSALKQALLINRDGVVFDKCESRSIKKIKDWAKDRGGEYVLTFDTVYNIMNLIDESVTFKVKNNRFYKKGY